MRKTWLGIDQLKKKFKYPVKLYSQTTETSDNGPNSWWMDNIRYRTNWYNNEILRMLSEKAKQRLILALGEFNNFIINKDDIDSISEQQSKMLLNGYVFREIISDDNELEIKFKYYSVKDVELGFDCIIDAFKLIIPLQDMGLCSVFDKDFGYNDLQFLNDELRIGLSGKSFGCCGSYIVEKE